MRLRDRQFPDLSIASLPLGGPDKRAREQSPKLEMGKSGVETMHNRHFQ